MTDQESTLQAVSDAQRILEEYLEPRPHNNERILDRLVEVLEQPDIIVAVDRLLHGKAVKRMSIV
jgi:5-methylcytosine-specific restriction endonuclease McrBC regulatory subunit McrC